MERIRTIEVSQHIGERVRVSGWLHSLRQLGGVSFLVIRDGWGTVQAVAETEEELAPLYVGESVGAAQSSVGAREEMSGVGELVSARAGVESVVAVEGQVVSMPQAPGGIELHNLHIEVITPVTEPPPVPLNKPKLPANITTLLDHAVVTNRHPARRAILRLAAGAMAGFRATLTARDF